MRLDAQRTGKTPGLAMIAIDEFSGIGSEHVVALFARGREAGIGVLVATQEMADLARAGRGVRDQVIGSTALKLILRQEVPESAQMVGEIAGTERAWQETLPIGGSLFGGPGGRGTRREVERFIIDPNQVKTLPTGQAVLISKLGGRRPQVITVTPPATKTVARPAPTVTRSVMHLGRYSGLNRSRSGPKQPARRPPKRRSSERDADLGR
jgi:hypothetical protein